MTIKFQHFEHLSQAIALIDPNGGIKYLNLSAKNLLNVIEISEEMNLLDIVENITLSKSRHSLIEALEVVNHTKNQTCVTINDEQYKEFTFNFTPDETDIIVEMTTKPYCAILEQDIFNFIVEKSSDMIFFKGEDLTYKFANETYLRFLNLEKDKLLGMNDEELASKGILSPILQYQCSQSDAEVIKKGTYSSIEFFSNESYYQMSKRKVNKGILCVARDITNEINACQEVEIDSITSLYNRKALSRVLKSIPKEKEYHMIEIILENFGEVTKDYGLLLGNRCLKQLAQLAKDYSDILFFHLEGVGFIGLFDKLIPNPEEFCQSFKAEVSKLNLLSALKVEVIVKKVNIESGLLSSVIED